MRYIRFKTIIFIFISIFCANCQSQKLLDPAGASTLHNLNCVITIDNFYYKTIQSGINANTNNCVVVIPASYAGSDSYTNPYNVTIIDYRNKQIKFSSNLTLPAGGLNANAINVFGPSGTNHSIGLVPDPGSTSGSTRFLRENGNWSVLLSSDIDSVGNITNNTTGQSGTTASIAGLIAGDGTTTTITGSGTSGSQYVVHAIGSGSGLTGPYNFTGQIVTLSNGSITAVGPPFSLAISCSAATISQLEVGNFTTNPNTCTLSYPNGGTAASASVVDNISHTYTQTTAYTTYTGAYQYCTAGQGVANFTFTGNSTSTTGQTAAPVTNEVSCLAREFGGVGTAGATGAVYGGSGNSETAVLSGGGSSGTLQNVGLGQHSTWGPYAPSNQYIYVIGTSSSCTFNLGPLGFLMNSPVAFTFTNQYTGPIPMYLYQSVNPQTSTALTITGTC